MNSASRLFFSSLLAVALTACSNDANPTEQQGVTDGNGRITLRGELTYRERMALPDDSGATVTLRDSDATEADINVITEIQLSDFGQVPIAFSLTYPEDVIRPEHQYVISAVIEDPTGNPIWKTPEPRPVDPLNENQELSLVLKRTKAEANKRAGGPIIYQCEDMRFTAEARRSTALLELQGRILELPSVHSASGAKYSDGETVFWAKGRQSALLTFDGKTYKNCEASLGN